jgi:aminopeptidase S
MPGLTHDSLRAFLSANALAGHLAAFQALVEDHGEGHRATGSATFAASVDHVEAELVAAGYRVERQVFAVGDAESVNLIAERAGTSADVLMLGAHLDSGAAGAGINDNATGVAALLVIADALSHLPEPAATVRFAFWGAEEGRTAGSQAFVEALEPDQLAEIRAYLNFDMLGSPNAVVFVYDEPEAAPGSVALTNVFSGFFAARGIAWDPIDLDGDSDHGPFIAAGIPTGGLFSGGIEPVTDAQAARHGSTAGEPADPCSHRACDTIDNVDISTLLLMTDAISYALAVLSGAAG